MKKYISTITLALLCSVFMFGPSAVFSKTALLSGPQLSLQQTISDEPLLGGNVVYKIKLENTAATAQIDRGYNLTITETLRSGLTFESASISPTFTQVQADGSTLIEWTNIADLEAQEDLEIFVTASIDSAVTIADTFDSVVEAEVNTMPDNSGAWISVSDTLLSGPQTIDIELEALQSTADEQATGAGEYDGNADWPYQYRATIKNNNVGSTENVVAKVILPAGVAYMGNPVISPNPNNANVTPSISLEADGSLELTWSLGTLTTAEYVTPVEITFDTAIPYKYRTSDDTAAANGPFAGPMSGNIIPEDAVMAAGYEATGEYQGANTSDGSQSTPADDPEEIVIAEYLTLHKSGGPGVVGIGTTINYSLTYYVSEYYDLENVVIVDVLPDGTSYVPNSASMTPVSVEHDTPGDGQTRITWEIPAADTEHGESATITFQATVDETYERAPYTGMPVVSGDSLTNTATISDDWTDLITQGRTGTVIPDSSSYTVQTRMPAFTKQVKNNETGQWTNQMNAYTGDTAHFRLTYTAAADIDQKSIIIRDYIPRGMTYIPNVESYVVNGTFSDNADCTADEQNAIIGNVGGLQYIEWRLCDVTRGSTWQVDIQAMIGDEPNVEPDWIVANFGKMSGMNTYGEGYSLRDMANVDYTAPELQLVKSADKTTNLQPGDIVTYTIDVTNIGRAAAYNLILEDVVPTDLLVDNNSDSASPSASSIASATGDPYNGNSGTLTWETIASLAVGETQSYTYQVEIPAGVFAGQSMRNVASVSYNSRSDNTGHQEATTTNTEDVNTDDETVYVRGVTLTKEVSSDIARIGDTLTWTLRGTVPSGVVAYWPVVEENDLPKGFDYVTGSSTIQNAVFDNTNHAENPLDNGNRDLRWFLDTIDNSAGQTDYNFVIEFDTLVTGVKGNNTATEYYLEHWTTANADNDAYIGWYDDATGYNNSGHANHGTDINKVDRRSPEADEDVTIIQPNLYLNKTGDKTVLAAGDTVTFTLQISNFGNAEAHDINIIDTLPAGMTYTGTQSQTITYPEWFPEVQTNFTDANAAGATNLNYQLDVLYVGAVLEIVYTTTVANDISAGLELDNLAKITSYSSQPGLPGDTNGDGITDERIYPEVEAIWEMNTPEGGILKAQDVTGELTFTNDITYTLTVPATPLDVTMYNVQVSDVIDSRLTVTGVTNGSHDGNNVSAVFAEILPGQQEVITISATVASDSNGKDGDLIENQASLTYTNSDTELSNVTAETLVAPALVVDKTANAWMVEAGDTLTYTISVQNVGNGVANNVVISDVIPNNMSYIANSAKLNGIAISEPVDNAWALAAPLAGGEAATLTFDVTIDSAEAGIAYINTASATADDSMGNPVPADNSSRVEADTDPTDDGNARVYGPLICNTDSSHVAFEDLKNTGWSDWDYNDVVIDMRLEVCETAEGNIAVVLADYEIVARGAGFDHAFRHNMPLSGGGQYALTVRDNAGNIISDEVSTFGNTAEFELLSSTRAALPPAAGWFTNTPADQADRISGHRASLLVTLDNPNFNPAQFLPDTPWDPYIYVYDTNEEVHLMIAGHMDNAQTVNPVYDPTSPMMGQDLPLAQTFPAEWRWPEEFIGIWNGYPDYPGYINTGGTNNTNWNELEQAAGVHIWGVDAAGNFTILANNTQAEPTSRYYAAPVMADLDGVGSSEVIMGNLAANTLEVYDLDRNLLWSKDVTAGVKTAATVTNLDGDAELEILVGSLDGKVYAFNHDGTAVPGWPVDPTGEGYRILASPAAANIDGDANVEVIIAAANGRLYAVEHDGTAKWDASLGDVAEVFDNQVINSTPVVSDIDGNGSKEIVVGGYDGKLYAFDSAGNQLWAYTTEDPVLVEPLVAELDDSSAGKEIVFASADSSMGYPRSFIYMLAADGTLLWQQFASWTGVQSSPIAGDLDGNGDLELLMGTNDGELRVWNADGSDFLWTGGATNAAIADSPVLGDVDGDGEVEVVAASDDGNIYAWEASGALVEGWPTEVGVTVKGTPLLVDLDEDAAVEAIYGDFNGTLSLVDSEVATVENPPAEGGNMIFLPLVMAP